MSAEQERQPKCDAAVCRLTHCLIPSNQRLPKGREIKELCLRSTLLCPSSVLSAPTPSTLSLDSNFQTSCCSPRSTDFCSPECSNQSASSRPQPERDFLLRALLPQTDTLKFTMLLYQNDVIVKLLSTADFLKLISFACLLFRSCTNSSENPLT